MVCTCLIKIISNGMLKTSTNSMFVGCFAIVVRIMIALANLIECIVCLQILWHCHQTLMSWNMFVDMKISYLLWTYSILLLVMAKPFCYKQTLFRCEFIFQMLYTEHYLTSENIKIWLPFLCGISKERSKGNSEQFHNLPFPTES